MNPESSTPSSELAEKIDRTFGSMDGFKEALTEKATGLFGSGWVWLSVDRDKKLHLNQAANANNPLRAGRIPLMACDVWEHAYYIDHRNDRKSFVEAWWKLIDWHFVSQNLASAMETQNQKYLEDCTEESAICEFLDELQNNERIES